MFFRISFSSFADVDVTGVFRKRGQRLSWLAVTENMKTLAPICLCVPAR
jgi:hypothetical protein